MRECSHEKSEPRRRAKSNGAEVVVLQCLACGAHIRELPKRQFGLEEIADMPLFDPDLREAYGAKQQELFAAEREDRLLEDRQRWEDDYNSWLEWYLEYLKTPQWRVKRSLVLQRCAGQCEACLQAPATEVHHLTYAHSGNEIMWELRGICRPCHERLTPQASKDRWAAISSTLPTGSQNWRRP